MDFTLPSFEDLIRTNHQQKTIPVKIRQLSTIESVVKKSKLKVAGYTRISTDHEEQLTSSRIQNEHLLTLASQHPEWEFVGVYCDIISGTKAENRPDLQRLLTDCRDGKINLVLTKSISRFARSTTDLLEMVRNLTACGVNIVFDKEHIDRVGKSEALLHFHNS